MNEPDFIRAAQSGDLEAFNQLVLAYQDNIFNTALRMLGDNNLAADLTQDAFIAAFRNITNFRGGFFGGWLTRIVINQCYDELRRKQRRPTVPLERNANDEEMESELLMADPTAGPEEICESHELEHAIEACLQSLTPAFRTILVLVDVEGHSYEEAAAILGIPINTVKSRLARARMRMSRELKRFNDQLPARYRIGLSQTVRADFAIATSK